MFLCNSLSALAQQGLGGVPVYIEPLVRGPAVGLAKFPPREGAGGRWRSNGGTHAHAHTHDT